MLDVFSRYVIGWMLANRESAILAERFIAHICAHAADHPRHATIHADRGSSMTSRPVALLMADLGLTKTHSRPHVSNDNPYSEAHFKTSSTDPTSPNASDVSKMAAPTALSSSTGTTPSTATRASGLHTPESDYGRDPSTPCSVPDAAYYRPRGALRLRSAAAMHSRPTSGSTHRRRRPHDSRNELSWMG